MVGVVITAVSIAHHGRHPADARLDQPGQVVFQVLAALGLTLGVILTDPASTLPMLLVQVVILATAALRLRPRQVVVIAVATAALSALLLWREAQAGQAAMSWPHPVLMGLWLLWTLLKGATTNLTGMMLRLALADSHQQLAAALDRVRQLAERDELTGLYNRRRVMEVMNHEWARCRRSGAPLSVAMLDIDHFKQINDRHGHPTGDAVLRSVGRLLQENLRGADTVGRFGGEEFLLVLPDARDAGAARDVAERIRGAIAAHDWQSIASGLQVTASLGVAVRDASDSAEALIARSDRGLYAAKHGGRNRVQVAPRVDG